MLLLMYSFELLILTPGTNHWLDAKIIKHNDQAYGAKQTQNVSQHLYFSQRLRGYSPAAISSSIFAMSMGLSSL